MPQLAEDEKLKRDLALVEEWFSYHAPTETQRDRLESARNMFSRIATYLVAHVADSRERAIALTELRKASMSVNMAIIFDRT